MTWLQPFVLWGLPLALLPVVIHLFNRLRHRSLPWAAMMFLHSANRKSTRYAKLRQWLILLLRVLGLAALALALSRPLAGGWLGWFFAPAPDVILVLLDRSASMEARDGNRQTTRRQQALELLAQAAKSFADTSRFVLIESATRTPRELNRISLLKETAITGPTDTAADVPGMVQTALDWLAQNKPGSAELWLATDLRRNDWQPDNGRWPSLSAGLAKLPQGVRARLLSLDREGEANASVQAMDVTRRRRGARAEIDLDFIVQRPATTPGVVPVTLVLDGARSQVELRLEGQSSRIHVTPPQDARDAGGWGSITLPADGNTQDNTAYFVYGPAVSLRSVVVATDAPTGRILQLAAAPNPLATNHICDRLNPQDVTASALANTAMVLWQAPLPRDKTGSELAQWVQEGGTLVLFPPGQPDNGRFEGVGWGAIEPGMGDKPWPLGAWDQNDGLLAKTEEGLSLPVNELRVEKRQAIVNERTALASFADGSPWLTRRAVGRGHVYFCATMPAVGWSSLLDGPVLVPMVQRCLQIGARRLSQSSMVECGRQRAGSDTWIAQEASGAKSPDLAAGVYRSGSRMIAVNRPSAEDDRDILEAEKARRLFGQVPVRMFTEQRGGDASFQSELWRAFLVVMLLFLVAESILVLPETMPHHHVDKGLEVESPRPLAGVGG